MAWEKMVKYQLLFFDYRNYKEVLSQGYLVDGKLTCHYVLILYSHPALVSLSPKHIHTVH